MTGLRTNSGKNLQRIWKIPALQTRYHKDGKFFMPLDRFPGALCDPKGYVVFQTKEQYEQSPSLDIGKRVNVRIGISKLKNYVLA